MNTFKWFVSKFRKPANPAGSKFIMGDTSKRREKREGSSMSERVQKGKNELQKVEKIYRLQIKSQVPGVIDGDITIPFVLDLTKTWQEVFKVLEIEFDPTKHLFRAYGRIIDDFTVPIHLLYDTYKNHRQTYYATILPRERQRKRKKPVPRRRKLPIKKVTNIAKPSANLVKKSIATPKIVTTKTSRPIRTLRKKTASSTIAGNRVQVNKVKIANVPCSSSSSSNDNPGVKVINKKAVIPDCVVSMNHVDNIPEGNEDAEGRIPFRFQPTSAFSQKPPHRNAPTAPPPMELQQLAFRDESTMAGEVLLPNEPELKNAILEYLTRHCSNRDMLSMRAELVGLKRAKKFQALNRLLPFTAGILQNAFIDDLK